MQTLADTTTAESESAIIALKNGGVDETFKGLFQHPEIAASSDTRTGSFIEQGGIKVKFPEMIGKSWNDQKAIEVEKMTIVYKELLIRKLKSKDRKSALIEKFNMIDTENNQISAKMNIKQD